MPVKQESIIGNLMSKSKKRGSKGRASTVPAWRSKLINPETEEDEKYGPTQFRRDHTSIWSDTLPSKRHTRRLSSSKVGLSGNSPTYVEFRGPSPTREQKCKDEIKMKLEMGSVEDLWKIYMESSAWNQDDGQKWPVLNEEFVKVRKRVASLLKMKMMKALESDQMEDLEAAIRLADGKVQILSVMGHHKFLELDKVFERLEQKQEEQQNAMRGLTKSSQPTMSFDAKDQARKDLADAVASQDFAQIQQSVQKCMEGGMDVSEALPHITLTSKYFAEEGDRSKGLFPLDCFKGEGRAVHVVNMGPEMDLNLLERLCAVAGVKYKYHTDPDGVMVGKEDRKSGLRKGTSVAASLAGKEIKFKSQVLENPLLNTIVLISGPEPARLEGDTAMLEKLLKFNKEGGGVMIVGSGIRRGGDSFPLIKDANIVCQVLGLGSPTMWGNDAGGKALSKQSAPNSTGFKDSHPIFSEIPVLDEGFSNTGLQDDILRKGYRELMRNSSGKLMTAIREPSESFCGESGAGPICVHASATQLLCSKEAQNVERFVSNLIMYLCLRKADVVEEYVP